MTVSTISKAYKTDIISIGRLLFGVCDGRNRTRIYIYEILWVWSLRLLLFFFFLPTKPGQNVENRSESK